jgi:hypothetical protein
VGIEHGASFLAEVVEEGIPAAIEDGGLRHGVLSGGTTAATLGIIAGFRSAFQMRPAGYGHGSNRSVARVGPTIRMALA